MGFRITISVLLAALLVASLAISCFSLTQAQSISKPSVPEFTLTFESHPYDVPPTTYTNVNPSTGETTSCNTAGYRDNNQTVPITIKNQPFSTGPNNTYWLFYDVRIKDYYHSNWTDPYGYFGISNSDYTVKLYFCNNPVDTQIEVQVEAILQNKTQIYFNNLLPGFPVVFQQDNFGYGDVWVPIASSDWSTIQTLSLSNGSTSLSLPEPTTLPTVSPTSQSGTSTSESPTVTLSPVGGLTTELSLDWLYAVVAVAVVAVFALLFIVIFFMHRRIRILELKQNGA